MKRILALILAAAMAMTMLAACGNKIDDGPADTDNVQTPGDLATPDGNDSTDNTVEPDNTQPPAGETWNGLDISFVEDNGIRYIWDQLSDDMKQNTAELMNAIKNVQLSCDLTIGVPDDQANDFLTFVYNCCIDYPYIGTSFNFPDTDGDGLRDRVTIPYNYSVATTEEDAQRLTAQLNQKLDEIIATVPADLDDWNRVLYLHNYLVFNTNYGENCLLPFTAYGAIVEGMATCQGYSDAMHLLMDRAGFECTYVIGYSDDDSATHKWNYVKLDDGQWYIVDPTWADPSGQTDPDYICYDYFMIDDETVLIDHLAKFDGLFHEAPVASSMERCWHKVMGYWCENYEEAYAAAEKQARECIEDGRRYIYLRFPDYDTFLETRQKLTMNEYGGELRDILAKVKEETGSDVITNSYSVYPKRGDTSPNTIIITLKFESDSAE